MGESEPPRPGDPKSPTDDQSQPANDTRPESPRVEDPKPPQPQDLRPDTAASLWHQHPALIVFGTLAAIVSVLGVGYALASGGSDSIDVTAYGGDGGEVTLELVAGPERSQPIPPDDLVVRRIDLVEADLRASGACETVERLGTSLVFAGRYRPCFFAFSELLQGHELYEPPSLFGGSGWLLDVTYPLWLEGRYEEDITPYRVEVFSLDGSFMPAADLSPGLRSADTPTDAELQVLQTQESIAGQLDVGANFRYLNTNE